MRHSRTFCKVAILIINCSALLFVLGISVFGVLAADRAAAAEAPKRVRFTGTRIIQLPAPTLSGQVSLEEAISKRRSVRQFTDKPLNFVQIGQLAWAGQGITDKQRNLRAAPSAGGIYPIELYFATADGLFLSHPQEHTLEQLQSNYQRKQLSSAAGEQKAIAEAPCNIIIAGSDRKVALKYGSKGRNFMLLEAGHVAENIQLQAVALGLAALPAGAFETKNVAKICQLSGDLEPVLIVCAGYPLTQEESASKPAGKPVPGVKRAVLILPESDYRDEEFFETRRILNEAGIATVAASPRIGPLRGMSGGLVASELTIDKVNVDDFDAVVFVGGPGAGEYFNNQTALTIARDAAAKGKVLAAISTAPTILANAGVLRNLRATGFITQRDSIQKAGAQYTGSPVERDGLIITASGPLAVIPFAQTIAGTLQEIETRSGKSP